MGIEGKGGREGLEGWYRGGHRGKGGQGRTGGVV